jgi:hypothetical protein
LGRGFSGSSEPDTIQHPALQCRINYMRFLNASQRPQARQAHFRSVPARRRHCAQVRLRWSTVRPGHGRPNGRSLPRAQSFQRGEFKKQGQTATPPESR